MTLKRYNMTRSNIFLPLSHIDCQTERSFPYMNGEESYRRIKLARNTHSNTFLAKISEAVFAGDARRRCPAALHTSQRTAAH